MLMSSQTFVGGDDVVAVDIGNVVHCFFVDGNAEGLPVGREDGGGEGDGVVGCGDII